jgi:hypothetical protein
MEERKWNTNAFYTPGQNQLAMGGGENHLLISGGSTSIGGMRK